MISSATYLQLPLLQNERLIVTATGSITAQFTAIINSNVGSVIGHNIAVTVLGSVVSEEGVGIFLNFYPVIGSSNDIVVIAAGGFVGADAQNGAVGMSGDGNIFNNAGTVVGGGGLYFASYRQGSITNSGSITGITLAALHLDTNSTTTVTNTGVLQGVMGVELIDSTARIFNGGQILATSEAGAAVDISQGSAGFILRNSGQISAPVKGIIGSAYADVITNSGNVEGTIDLGSGADRFFGRAGLLDSKISGGAGDDLINSGRGDDVVDGGSGNDTLAGNLGDDTLAGSVGLDTFVFARRGGDDVVQSFAHNFDKVDLKAFHFTNFAAVSSLLQAHPGGVELDLTSHGGGTVEFAGLTLALLTTGDFLL
jgi:Ca2+-binding RTX toxin-like protein